MRLNLESSLWSNPRFQTYMIKIGDRHRAIGTVVDLWTLAQQFWCNKAAPRGLISGEAWREASLPEDLISCGLAERRENGIYARGSEEHFKWWFEGVEQRRAAGRKGGQKSAQRSRDEMGRLLSKDSQAEPNGRLELVQAKPSKSNPSSSLSFSSSSSSSFSNSGSEEKNIAGVSAGAPHHASVNPDGPSSTAMVWRAYKKAYEERHGAAPSWSAKAAGQIRSFVSRVPSAEAPEIAAFFVSHPDGFYVRSKHPLGLLLRDADKIRTEWITGRTVTGAQARQQEKTAGYQDQLRRITEGSL